MQNHEQLVVIGRIAGVFGVKGWVKLMSFTCPRENIFNYSPWLIKTQEGWCEFIADDSQQRGERLIAKLNGIDSPEQAREMMRADIVIHKTQLPPLNEGEYYWHDLIGLEVFNQEQENLGEVSEIVETGANDVLIIKADKQRRYLIPLIMDIYVKQVDLSAKTMLVDWHKDD